MEEADLQFPLESSQTSLQMAWISAELPLHTLIVPVMGHGNSRARGRISSALPLRRWNRKWHVSEAIFTFFGVPFPKQEFPQVSLAVSLGHGDCSYWKTIGGRCGLGEGWCGWWGGERLLNNQQLAHSSGREEQLLLVTEPHRQPCTHKEPTVYLPD